MVNKPDPPNGKILHISEYKQKICACYVTCKVKIIDNTRGGIEICVAFSP